MHKFPTLLILTLSACLAACSSSEPKELKAIEIPSSQKVNIDASQEALFNTSTKLFQKELYSVAKESFESLKNGYPAGAYAEFAEVKLADSYFAGGEYEAASLLYENFVRDHPSSKSTPYMTFQAGRSHQLSSKGIGRDTAPLEKALEYYNRFLQQYPDSIYTSCVQEHKKEAQHQLALHEQLVLDFYRNQEQEEAYKVRFEEFTKTWLPLLAKQEIDDTVIAPPMPAGAPLSAPQVLAVQRVDAAGTDSESAVASGAADAESPATVKPVPSPAAEASEESAPPSPANVHHAQCVAGRTNMVLLYLSSSEFLQQTTALLNNRVVETSEGLLVFTLPAGTFKAIDKDCFGQNDLHILKDGTVKLAGVESATLMTIDNPPRLIITLGGRSISDAQESVR